MKYAPVCRALGYTRVRTIVRDWNYGWYLWRIAKDRKLSKDVVVRVLVETGTVTAHTSTIGRAQQRGRWRDRETKRVHAVP